jgi:uncharacterized ubiquitin-like protein YukD
MKYILVANNKRLNANLINKANIEKDDVIIVFNYMWPFFNFDTIRDHPNKIFIGRQRPIKPETINLPFAGIDLVKEHEDKFQKIIFHSHPKFLSDKNEHKQRFQNGIDYYNFNPDKIDYLEPVSHGNRKRIGYPQGKNMSTGIIAYDYITQIKKNTDTILLLGFTSELARSFHNDNWEVNYFRDQIKKNKCLAIGGCDLEQQKYEHIYNNLKWKSYLQGNHGKEAEHIIRLLKPTSIIDIGCGSNLFCKQTIKDSVPCIGIDFAGNYKDMYGDICVGLTNIADKQFDLVTCFDTLEHLIPSCVENALIEMQRISDRFILQIDYKESILSVLDSSLHQTVKGKGWWLRRLKDYCSDVQQSGKYLYGSWKPLSC